MPNELSAPISTITGMRLPSEEERFRPSRKVVGALRTAAEYLRTNILGPQEEQTLPKYALRGRGGPEEAFLDPRGRIYQAPDLDSLLAQVGRRKLPSITKKGELKRLLKSLTERAEEKGITLRAVPMKEYSFLTREDQKLINIHMADLPAKKLLRGRDFFEELLEISVASKKPIRAAAGSREGKKAMLRLGFQPEATYEDELRVGYLSPENAERFLEGKPPTEVYKEPRPGEVADRDFNLILDAIKRRKSKPDNARFTEGYADLD